MDELIVFLMREFGWQYEYTRDLVGKLPLKILNALVAETKYQRTVEDYKLASYAAMIVVALVSDKQHRRTIKDIIGNPPERERTIKPRSLSEAAEKAGIIMPKED